MTDEIDQCRRLEAAKQFILAAFDIACKAHALPRPELAAAVKDAMGAIDLDEPVARSPRLPVTAPEQWADRTDRKEKPVDFVRRIYAPFIGSGLSRADLLKLDPNLYRALSVWENRHPEDRMTEIPTKSEVIDTKIAALSSHLPPDELRLLGAALQTRATRRRRQPSLP